MGNEPMIKENPLWNNPEHFNDLTEEQQSILLEWINETFTPKKSFYRYRTSYGLKQWFTSPEVGHPKGFYITNGQFKGAMIQAGFKVKNPEGEKWFFNVYKRSHSVLVNNRKSKLQLEKPFSL